jgi:hypothetical protein
MVHAFDQATSTLEGFDGACELSSTEKTVMIPALCTAAGYGLLRRDPTVVEIRIAFSSAIGLVQPQRTNTSFVVSSILAPGLWNSRIAFARTLARRKRFETCVIAPKTRSERI